MLFLLILTTWLRFLGFMDKLFNTILQQILKLKTVRTQTNCTVHLIEMSPQRLYRRLGTQIHHTVCLTVEATPYGRQISRKIAELL